MYVSGRILEIEPDAFDSIFVVEVKEAAPAEPEAAEALAEPIIQEEETPKPKRSRRKRNV